jgi:hypothetical protein
MTEEDFMLFRGMINDRDAALKKRALHSTTNEKSRAGINQRGLIGPTNPAASLPQQTCRSLRQTVNTHQANNSQP